MMHGFSVRTGRVALVLAAALALAACSGGNEKAGRTPQRKGETGSKVTIQRYASAPDVELRGIDGSMARLSGYRGNIVVFSFLATWNKDSARQAAVLNELHARLRGSNFRVVGVFIDNSGKQALQRYMKNNTVNFPAYYNGLEVAAKFGGPPRLPTTYVILGDGSIYEREVGVRSVNDLESTLKAIATKRL